MLKLNNINVFYGKKQILLDTSLAISQDDRLLLIGPNGAGKSTLIKAICGVISDTEGQITFLDKSISSWSPYKRINAGFGYLLQTKNIVPGLTVKENLLLGGYSLGTHVINTRIEETLSIFEFLREKINTRAGLLSGGERQALAISMVLMKRPQLLLLDEPSAGLSPKAASEILAHVKNIQERLGIKAVCMVEHNLRLALPWATRVAVLVSGKVVHISENPQQYLTNPEELEKFFFG